MSILYFLTAPSPPFAGTDAVFQDVAALQTAFDGEVVNLSPLHSSKHRFPKQLFGFHKIREIKRLESRCKINHIFFSSPYAFPILRLLRKPIFYTVTASLDLKRKPPACAQLQGLQGIIVSSERDAAVLRAWGLTNHAIVPPGVDTVGLTPAPLAIERELVLLMASAPWNRRQFNSKGIDLLLATAAALPFLRLILLWRGVLADEISRRVDHFGLGSRVEIVNRKVDINGYLQRAHASIVLADDGGLVKSFPHSLIESLAAGKPVLLSHTIAMADDVEKNQTGIVVTEMSVAALTAAISSLRGNYDLLARNALQSGRSAYSIAAMVENHRRLYETVPI